jgi:hypothetical protein
LIKWHRESEIQGTPKTNRTFQCKQELSNLISFRQDEQIQEEKEFLQDEHPEQDEEMQCSCPSNIADANTLENLFCLSMIGITSYSIYTKLDLGA